MAARTSSTPHTPALLGLELDRRSGTPTFRLVAEQLRARIHSGALPGGTRLPPSRQLATQFGIARNCIVEAYDELIADGLIEGRGRHGTFVASRAVVSGHARSGEISTPVVLQRHRLQSGSASDPREAAFDWRPGQAHAHALPLNAWRTACREAGRHLPPQDYGDPRGDAGIRRAIVEWLEKHRSVRVTVGQIVVTQGTGQALDLIARALVRPGDCCATEDPGYANAALSFSRAGAWLRHVPVDENGMCVEEAFRGDATPVLLHITPAHQYPMGGRLSGQRRRALIDAARTHGTLILENEYDCEFNYAGTNYPPIFSSAPESTLLLSTFAKAVSPALRLGFVVAPQHAAAALAGLIERERLHASWTAQKVMESLFRSGELDRHLRRVRRHYAALRDLIRSRLGRYCDRIAVLGDEGGLHVVVRGCTHELDRTLKATLQKKDIRFDTVRQFATAPKVDGFLLAYGHMSQAMLTSSIDEIVHCLDGIYIESARSGMRQRNASR
ncbi:MocR-like pyridoxine biosynthesis transcription factor PdxR [Janthinobacterium agaricidamnosum]|uniref:Bacterial regulatory s, gntR family protein n=1 Tax=Janthinobacterium agaricidamnosum NBRC 102515 = DSM 9628 TaxID=1349767 RepID=W0V103_9BURK|nr:PLP-dependent aminotransferase family protein [Janthinobacterium agaricidamnosum]CDG82499.1 bacterial regulatory s, gntR family protein [Janthinobacterium agaricidamnosum NBRC 102515 = DSM 9628]